MQGKLLPLIELLQRELFAIHCAVLIILLKQRADRLCFERALLLSTAAPNAHAVCYSHTTVSFSSASYFLSIAQLRSLTSPFPP